MAKLKMIRMIVFIIVLVFFLSFCAEKMPNEDAKLKGKAKQSLLESDFGNGLIMVCLPAGSFKMDLNSGEVDEKPVSGVKFRLSIRVELDGFWIGKYEVTQSQWQTVMGSNPSNFKAGNDYPVEQVSWEDVQDFISRLNRQTGQRFRLPTEAEWEYACRAGTSGERYGDLDAIAWYIYNSGYTTHPVGKKQANAWGLYDMLGNVLEWCQDWYGSDYYSSSSVDNPSGPSSGSRRVVRGGSWNHEALFARAALRISMPPFFSDNNLGFRLVMDSE